MYGNRYLLISFLFHLLFIWLVYRAPATYTVQQEPTEIVLVPAGHKHKQTHKPGNTQVQKTVNPPRVGQDEYMQPGRPLGQRLSADFYLERLKLHIEPHWRRFLAEAIRNKEAAPSPCTSVLNIDANAQGDILTIVVASTTCSKKVTDIGIKSINYAGLLPPPKDILVNNTLYLQWSFVLLP